MLSSCPRAARAGLRRLRRLSWGSTEPSMQRSGRRCCEKPSSGEMVKPISPPRSSPAPLLRQEEGSRVARGKGRLSSALHSCSDPCCPSSTSGPALWGCGCAGGGSPAPKEGLGMSPGLCAHLGTRAAPGPSCSSTSLQIAVISSCVLARL